MITSVINKMETCLKTTFGLNLRLWSKVFILINAMILLASILIAVSMTFTIHYFYKQEDVKELKKGISVVNDRLRQTTESFLTATENFAQGQFFLTNLRYLNSLFQTESAQGSFSRIAEDLLSEMGLALLNLGFESGIDEILIINTNGQVLVKVKIKSAEGPLIHLPFNRPLIPLPTELQNQYVRGWKVKFLNLAPDFTQPPIGGLTLVQNRQIGYKQTVDGFVLQGAIPIKLDHAQERSTNLIGNLFFIKYLNEDLVREWHDRLQMEVIIYSGRNIQAGSLLGREDLLDDRTVDRLQAICPDQSKSIDIEEKKFGSASYLGTLFPLCDANELSGAVGLYHSKEKRLRVTRVIISWMAAITLLVFLLSIPVSMVFSLVLTRPLKRLAEGVLSFQNGRWKEISVDSHDEFQELALTFNLMADKVQAYIIDLQAAKNEIKQNEEFLQDIFNAIQDGIMVLDKDMHILMANPAIERFNHRGSGTRFKKCHEVFHDEPNPCPGCFTYDAIINKTSTGGIRSFVDLNGQTLLWEFFAYPILDSHGEVSKVVEYSRDITERHRTQQALHQEKERFKVLAEESPFGISIIAADGTYIYVNPKFVELFGYTLEDVPTGKDWFCKAFPDPEQKKKAIASWIADLKTMVKTKPRHRVFTLMCKDRSEKTIRFYAVSMANGDQFVIYEDLTTLLKAEEETWKAEEKLKQAQKMEAIGTLAGGIAHDFNNILAAIIGSTELALLETSEGSSTHQKLSQILSASQRAKGLVRQILNFSRQSETDYQAISFTAIIKEALILLKSVLPTSIKIEQDFEPGPLTIWGDPIQIQQIMMNLCSNSAYSMGSKGGIISIKVFLEEIDQNRDTGMNELPPGAYCCLQVSDTGQGMKLETMNRIFDPFFTTKAPGEGTGMGLSVVYGIVKSHRGTIKVSSELGKGTTFKIYLPFFDYVPPEKPKDVTTPLPVGSERILLIDDEETVASTVTDMLEYLGYEVTCRTSSLEALELFRLNSKDFDLVITDQTMPYLSGVDLTQEILKIDPEIPVILCTGYSNQVFAETAPEMGIKRFLMKPLVLREVAEVVRAVLDGRM